MKKRLSATILALLILSGCGSAAVESTHSVGPFYSAEYRTLEPPTETAYNLCLMDGIVYDLGSREEMEGLWAISTEGREAKQLRCGCSPEELSELLPEGATDLNKSLYNLIPGAEGELLAFGTLSYSLPDPNNDVLFSDGSRIPMGRQEYLQFVEYFDTEGESKSFFFLPELSYWVSPLTDAEGRLAILDEGMVLHLYSRQGEMLKKMDAQRLGYASQLLRLPDGQMAVLSLGSSNLELWRIDWERETFDKLTEIPEWNASVWPGAFGWDYLVNSGTQLYGINADGARGPILVWLNADLDGNLLTSLLPSQDGDSVLCLFSDRKRGGSGQEIGLARIQESDFQPQNEKTVLTLACMGLEDSVAEAVLRFNRSDPVYRIQVKDYSVYNSSDTMNAGLTALHTDIIAGHIPDLFCTKELPIHDYERLGLLEDLWPWIEADAELGGRDALVTPLFDALSLKGALYQIAPFFEIYTVCGKTSLLGNRQGWTLQEFHRVWDNLPEGTQIMDDWKTRESALISSLCIRVDDFVDRDTGSCSFDSEEFRELILFAELFPQQVPRQSEKVNESLKIRDGEQMLKNCCLVDFRDIAFESDLIGEPVSFVGLPGAGGNGSAFDILGGMSMSANSPYKEAAWRFMREVLDKDRQLAAKNGLAVGFPTNRAAFDTLLARERKAEYQKNPDGSLMLDAQGQPIELPRGGRQVIGGPVTPIYALTDAQTEQFLTLLENTHAMRYWDDTVIDVVREEAAAYYAGDKSLDQICASIQKRIQLQLDEKK